MCSSDLCFGSPLCSSPHPSLQVSYPCPSAAICRAVGVQQLNDTAQLHNLPMTITVAIDKNDPTRNVIKSYKPKKSASAPAQQSGGSAAGGAAPWARP